MKILSHIDNKIRTFLLQIRELEQIDSPTHIINYCLNTGLVSELENLPGYRLNEEGYKFLKSTDQKQKS